MIEKVLENIHSILYQNLNPLESHKH